MGEILLGWEGLLGGSKAQASLERVGGAMLFQENE
jgi:hypothetical protein